MNKINTSQLLRMPGYNLSRCYILIGLFLLLEALFLFALGENIYVSMHDNLDLHIADYHLLSKTDTFFSHDVQLPLLNGISRDYFASEFSLYSLLYILLPTNTAYIVGYLLKTIIAIVSSVLLGRDIFCENYKKYETIIVLSGFAFGILPLYPAFSFSFVSLPLVILLIRKIMRQPKAGTYLLLFLYPLLSYFTFIGFFILGYLLVFLLVSWFRQKKFPFSLLTAFFVLSAGYIVFEYRLFNIMLFDSTPTIRETMVTGSYHIKQIAGAVIETFTKGIFHADAVHTWFVLPVCMLYFLYLNFRYIQSRNFKGMKKDAFNLIFLLIFLNCIIYGLSFQENLQKLIAFLVPPMKGFQFNRTVFFNPLLWYIALFIILKRLYDLKKERLAHGIVLASIAVILLTGSKYNDLYHTLFNYAYRIIKQQPSNNLTYQEFYSEDLFTEILEDINYQGEKSAAYGMHPAVLSYSGITSLDGCLSYYPQAYKNDFRTIIAPALDRVESFRLYYDNWGARAYFFAGIDENIYEPLRSLTISDTNLYINADAFRKMGGTYIFSRFEIPNADQLHLSLKGLYKHHKSPYTIYLYSI